jgi:hypothetical protein
MRNSVTIGICAICMATMANAQTAVYKYEPGVTNDGVVYYLPKTVLKIAITATRTTQIPGDFHSYAKRFLRLDDVANAANTQWKIDNAKMVAVSALDTSKAHVVQLKKGTSAPLCSLSDDGVLLAINAQAKKYEEPSFDTSVKSTTTKVNSRDYLSEEILSAGSELKMAELTAAEIYGIRESRRELTKGEADYMPTDGEQLKLMLAKLDEQENALMQLFKGYVETETKTWIVYFTPEYGDGREILARFSDSQGLVDKDNLAGEPIYIDIKNQKSVPHGRTEVLDKKMVNKVVYYNVPSQATVDLSFNKDRLLKQTLPLAQFGHEEFLSEDLFNKRASCQIWFSPLTGNIEKVEDLSMSK